MLTLAVGGPEIRQSVAVDPNEIPLVDRAGRREQATGTVDITGRLADVCDAYPQARIELTFDIDGDRIVVTADGYSVCPL